MGKYVPSTSEEQQEMLKAVGVSSFDELYTVVPSGIYPLSGGNQPGNPSVHL